MTDTVTEVPSTRLFVGGGNGHDHGHRDGYNARDAVGDLSRHNGVQFANTVEAVGNAGVRAVEATHNAESRLHQSEQDTEARLAKSNHDVEARLQKAVCDEGQHLSRLIFDSSVNLTRDIKTEGAASQLATEKTAAAINLAVEKTAAQTQNYLISGFKDARFDAVTFASAAALAAATNTAAIQAALAACCCEIKERVSGEGDETRALINTVDRARADRELVVAQNEITYLKGRIPPGTPV